MKSYPQSRESFLQLFHSSEKYIERKLTIENALSVSRLNFDKQQRPISFVKKYVVSKGQFAGGIFFFSAMGFLYQGTHISAKLGLINYEMCSAAVALICRVGGGGGEKGGDGSKSGLYTRRANLANLYICANVHTHTHLSVSHTHIHSHTYIYTRTHNVRISDQGKTSPSLVLKNLLSSCIVGSTRR